MRLMSKRSTREAATKGISSRGSGIPVPKYREHDPSSNPKKCAQILRPIFRAFLLVLLLLVAVSCTVIEHCAALSRDEPEPSRVQSSKGRRALPPTARPQRSPAPFEPICSEAGWCWSHPLPHGNDYMTIWGTDPSNIYAVGEAGIVLHFDGERWSFRETGVRQDLRGVWGLGADDLYIVGEHIILHFDGETWRHTEREEDLYAIWGSGPDDIYVSGADGVLLHFDGLSWTEHESGTTARLVALWGSSRRNVYAVGTGGRLIRFDGRSWQDIQSGTREDLRGIWGTGRETIFAVGNAGTVLRFDGEDWERLDVQIAGGQNLSAIWGTGPGNVFVVSETGRIFNFDAARWTTQVERCALEPCGALTGIWGSGPRDLYAVGDHGNVLHSSGGGWSTLWPPSPDEPLRSLWVSHEGVAFALSGGHAVLRHGEEGWTTLLDIRDANELLSSVGTDAPSTIELREIWGASSESLFVVGTNGLCLHYDGELWSVLETPTDRELRAIWGTGGEDIFAVGENVTILHYDGMDWHLQIPESNSPLSGSLNDVWGSDPSDVYAVGEDGLVLRYDGSNWMPHMTSVQTELLTVWGTGLGRVYAAGRNHAKGARGKRVLIRYDGRFWKVQRPLPAGREEKRPYDIDRLWGTSRFNLYALADGALYHTDGAGWRQVPMPPTGTFLDIDGVGPETIYISGEGRLLMSYRPPPESNGSSDAGPSVALDGDVAGDGGDGQSLVE